MLDVVIRFFEDDEWPYAATDTPTALSVSASSEATPAVPENPTNLDQLCDKESKLI